MVLLLVNAGCTWFMCGVIWFVQAVHYPLFARYDPAGFAAAMRDHQRRTGRVVAGPMIAELATAAGLLVIQPAGVPIWQPAVGLALAAVWAGSTAWVQVPLHARLERDPTDRAAARRLVRTNWVRTAAWSARGVMCGVMLAAAG